MLVSKFSIKKEDKHGHTFICNKIALVGEQWFPWVKVAFLPFVALISSYDLTFVRSGRRCVHVRRELVRTTVLGRGALDRVIDKSKIDEKRDS